MMTEATLTRQEFECAPSVAAFDEFEKLESFETNDEPLDQEPPCESKLGYSALCASCPLVRMLGECPKDIRERSERSGMIEQPVLDSELDMVYGGLLFVDTQADVPVVAEVDHSPIHQVQQKEVAAAKDETLVITLPIASNEPDDSGDVDRDLVARVVQPEIAPRRSIRELLFDDTIPVVIAPALYQSQPIEAPVIEPRPQREDTLLDEAPVIEVEPIRAVVREVEVSVSIPEINEQCDSVSELPLVHCTVEDDEQGANDCMQTPAVSMESRPHPEGSPEPVVEVALEVDPEVRTAAEVDPALSMEIATQNDEINAASELVEALFTEPISKLDVTHAEDIPDVPPATYSLVSSDDVAECVTSPLEVFFVPEAEAGLAQPSAIADYELGEDVLASEPEIDDSITEAFIHLHPETPPFNDEFADAPLTPLSIRSPERYLQKTYKDQQAKSKALGFALGLFATCLCVRRSC